MGTTTPNIGLYIPADGETNYGTSFANGMLNLDTHDHSGPPNKGVPISSAGLAAGSVTRDKLNANVFGAGVHPDANNAIEVDGVLLPIFQLGTNGLIVRTSGSTAASRTITGTANQITVTNGDGVAGNPTLSLPNTFYASGTFTPTLTSSGGALTGLSYTVQNGVYQRIGNWVMVSIAVQASGTGNAGAPDFRITSLPFNAVGDQYWISGYWVDTAAVVLQTTVSYSITGAEPTFFDVFIDSAVNGTVDTVPAGAWNRNYQFTGIYRIA